MELKAPSETWLAWINLRDYVLGDLGTEQTAISDVKAVESYLIKSLPDSATKVNRYEA